MTRLRELQSVSRANGFSFYTTSERGFTRFWFYNGDKPGALPRDSCYNVLGIGKAEIYVMGRVHGVQSRLFLKERV